MGDNRAALSTKKGKRKNGSGTSTPNKTPRVASPVPDTQVAIASSSSSKNGMDPMEALEGGDDPMERLTGAEAGDEAAIVPTRADEFEQEAEREVEASKGLDGQAEEGKMKLVHQVRHQVAIPPNFPYVPINQHKRKDPPAREYAFTLDPFQFVATSCIERNESVLVSAHTSAGKTVVAEFAIATCLKEGRRVVYTSPIKALSNQKYREFTETFSDVGLMTGDVTINPTASCLVMTTEILRSMLYRGSEVMREVAWVVFDEVHYMRDKERGVVWEETIILLPHTVRYVFLSATIPNSMEFAEWICKTHEQPCHIVYTDFRPTPLQHYLFPADSEGIYLVVDEQSNFREDNFQKAMAALAHGQGEDSADPNSGRGKKGKTKKGGALKEKSDIYKIVKLIMARNLNPVIIFAFSKRECEQLAMQMSKLDFNTEDEAAAVEQVFESAIGALSEDDKKLPQIELILPLLKRGIGIHHGGLLPILKEVIEILFQEGLIKALFATETFSIGLNMPAKTVVFTSVRKFDGKDFRNLSGGEYIQMSGRAGRRGLDARGIVIMMCDEKIEPDAAKSMVKGQADRLDSAFHLGYNMIINLMRVEGISPEFMLERCFFQFQNTMSVPVLEKELKEAEEERDAIVVKKEEEIKEYYDLRQLLKEKGQDFQAVITHPTYSLPFLNSGRLVEIKEGDKDFGWGIVLAYNKVVTPRGRPPVFNPASDPPQKEYVVDVLVKLATGTQVSKDSSISSLHPPGPGDAGQVSVIPVLLSTIQSISQLRVKVPADLRSQGDKNTVYRALGEVMRRMPGGPTLLDPIKNMGITDKSFMDLVKQIQLLEDKLNTLPITKDPKLPSLYDTYDRKLKAIEHVKSLKRKISSVHDVLQLEELKSRKRVLRRLGFTTSDDVVEMKGRVACEISSGDELLLTELMFGGTFNPLAPEHCAALLSCFAFQEKSETAVKLKEELAAPLRELQEAARRIAKVSNESGIAVVEDEYVQSFKVEMMDAVLQWCKGAKFADICKMTDVFEGSLIRMFKRLQELIRQMGQAAHAIGNTELEEKFAKSMELLERPNTVVFNPSLYL